MKPILFGCEGLTLGDDERSFFAEAQPFGFILFRRNCETPDQVTQLTQDLRDAVGYHAPIFIDQEGGRVQRLVPPAWLKLPALRALGALYERDVMKGFEAARIHARLIARQLVALGINGNFSPVLDLLIPNMSEAIGERAISRNPAVVLAIASEIIKTFLVEGVFPVIKHMPGHGRVVVDPHYDLPVVETPLEVLEAEDFLPFRYLNDAPFGMNCHVVFKAIDEHNPVSMSPKAHAEIIRGSIGFKGILFSDDLAMGALKAPLPDRALRALEAGADLPIYCPGKLPEMREIAAVLPEATPEFLQRWQEATQRVGKAQSSVDLAADFYQLKNLLAA